VVAAPRPTIPIPSGIPTEPTLAAVT
jgi:hypothetical protein